MTIFCTSSPNDADLVHALGSLATCIPIPHGDCCFFGVSEDTSGVEVPVRVLVERKHISDMVNSIVSGRYIYQAQAAHDSGFDVLCLVVEGEVRPNPDDGVLEVPKWRRISGKLQRVWEPVAPVITYSRWDQYLTELDYLVGIIVKRSVDVRETAAIVKALWQNFQVPPSKHQSLHQIYSQPIPRVELLQKPGLVRRVAKELDGIGWGRSAEVAKRFPTVKAMVDASIQDWLEIPGIGKKTAQKVVSGLNGSQWDT